MQEQDQLDAFAEELRLYTHTVATQTKTRMQDNGEDTDTAYQNVLDTLKTAEELDVLRRISKFAQEFYPQFRTVFDGVLMEIEDVSIRAAIRQEWAFFLKKSDLY